MTSFTLLVWTCQQVYVDKFSLLTHTDEQNLYFDKFFHDKCTCSKASMLASEQVHLS